MGIYITFKVGPDEWSEKLDLNEDHALAIEAEKSPEVKAAYEVHLRRQRGRGDEARAVRSGPNGD